MIAIWHRAKPLIFMVLSCSKLFSRDSVFRNAMLISFWVIGVFGSTNGFFALIVDSIVFLFQLFSIERYGELIVDC